MPLVDDGDGSDRTVDGRPHRDLVALVRIRDGVVDQVAKRHGEQVVVAHDFRAGRGRRRHDDAARASAATFAPSTASATTSASATGSNSLTDSPPWRRRNLDDLLDQFGEAARLLAHLAREFAHGVRLVRGGLDGLGKQGKRTHGRLQFV